MPTGYTYKIKDGIGFEEYALSCAKAFGACIAMRDDPADTPIPEKFEKSDHHSEKLEEAHLMLNDFLSQREDDLIARFSKEREKAIENNRKYINEKVTLKQKYLNMLSQVNKFTPPTSDHVNFKNFMKEQIENSIDFDCNTSYDEEAIKKWKEMKFEDWKKETLEHLRWGVEYHEKEGEKEKERVDSRNEWISELRKAIKEVG